MKNYKCFAFVSMYRCNAVGYLKCNCKTCAFFMTHTQYAESCKRSNKRLASLDTETQRHIADKYYNGNLDWLEGLPV